MGPNQLGPIQSTPICLAWTSQLSGLFMIPKVGGESNPNQPTTFYLRPSSNLRGPASSGLIPNRTYFQRGRLRFLKMGHVQLIRIYSFLFKKKIWGLLNIARVKPNTSRDQAKCSYHHATLLFCQTKDLSYI